MIANLILDNVKAYDVEKFDIRLGEVCTVELIEAPMGVRWFSDNDDVLSIKVSDGRASIKALSKGDSEIQIQSEGILAKTIKVSVYDTIAVSLNPTAGNPESK